MIYINNVPELIPDLNVQKNGGGTSKEITQINRINDCCQLIADVSYCALPFTNSPDMTQVSLSAPACSRCSIRQRSVDFLESNCPGRIPWRK